MGDGFSTSPLPPLPIDDMEKNAGTQTNTSTLSQRSLEMLENLAKPEEGQGVTFGSSSNHGGSTDENALSSFFHFSDEGNADMPNKAKGGRKIVNDSSMAENVQEKSRDNVPSISANSSRPLSSASFILSSDGLDAEKPSTTKEKSTTVVEQRRSSRTSMPRKCLNDQDDDRTAILSTSSKSNATIAMPSTSSVGQNSTTSRSERGGEGDGVTSSLLDPSLGPIPMPMKPMSSQLRKIRPRPPSQGNVLVGKPIFNVTMEGNEKRTVTVKKIRAHVKDPLAPGDAVPGSRKRTGSATTQPIPVLKRRIVESTSPASSISTNTQPVKRKIGRPRKIIPISTKPSGSALNQPSKPVFRPFPSGPTPPIPSMSSSAPVLLQTLPISVVKAPTPPPGLHPVASGKNGNAAGNNSNIDTIGTIEDDLYLISRGIRVSTMPTPIRRSATPISVIAGGVSTPTLTESSPASSTSPSQVTKESTRCHACGLCAKPDMPLLTCQLCAVQIHTICCDPPLENVVVGWKCPSCVPSSPMPRSRRRATGIFDAMNQALQCMLPNAFSIKDLECVFRNGTTITYDLEKQRHVDRRQDILHDKKFGKRTIYIGRSNSYLYADDVEARNPYKELPKRKSKPATQELNLAKDFEHIYRSQFRSNDAYTAERPVLYALTESSIQEAFLRHFDPHRQRMARLLSNQDNDLNRLRQWANVRTTYSVDVSNFVRELRQCDESVKEENEPSLISRGTGSSKRKKADLSSSRQSTRRRNPVKRFADSPEQVDPNVPSSSTSVAQGLAVGDALKPKKKRGRPPKRKPWNLQPETTVIADTAPAVTTSIDVAPSVTAPIDMNTVKPAPINTTITPER